MVADANRLAALSTTVGRLDLALLLAAQGVRLADTPETQDGLLAALAEHGRAERVIGFDGFPNRDEPHRRGTGAVLRPRTCRRGPGPGRELPRRGRSLEYPLDPQGELGGWLIAAPSPTDDVLLAVGVLDGLALGANDRGGRFRAPRRRGIGDRRRPGRRRVQPRRSLRSAWSSPCRTPRNPDSAARWRLVEVDVADGTVRDTGLDGVVPAPVGALGAHVDGDAAVLWDGAGPPAPS